MRILGVQFAIVLLAGGLVAVTDAAAQQTGELLVRVTDASAAAIPSARVELRPEANSGEATASLTTDRTGHARFKALAPGKYSLHVQSDGFKSLEKAVAIEAGRTSTVVVQLDVGQVSETVEVGRGKGSGFGGIFRRHKSAPPPAAAMRAGIAGWNIHTEEYSHIAENGFRAVADDPLSTFSIDVDTASYANVRRFLRDGSMPPKDAVRIEELLNYFRYDDPVPEPDAEHPVRITTELTVCPWEPRHRLARIALRSRAIDLKDLPASSLTFLIDVSGSMSDRDKLPLLRDALAMFANQLRPQDRVSIVVYAGAAGVVLPPTPGSRKGEVLAALEGLRAGGSTAGAAGIQLAYQLARENYLPQGNNRVILATDGDFNVGVSSQGELVRLIEKEREAGVFLTVLGFGQGNLADARMEQIADHGNGQYLYIDSALEARRALVQQIGGTLHTVAKDVKIQVEFNPTRVAKYRLIGYENRLLAAQDFADDKKDAGEMGAGHSVAALYEIVPAGAEGAGGIDLRYQERAPTEQAKTSGELMTVKLRYKPPTADESLLVEQRALDSDRPLEKAGQELRWSAAVAQYGMLLRDSEHKGKTSWESTAALAQDALGADPDGLRAELLYLIKTAQGLAPPVARQRP